MSTLLDDLLSGYTGQIPFAHPTPTPAKAANHAKSEHPCGLEPDFGSANFCEFLRKPEPSATDSVPDSQTFAAIRKPKTGQFSEETCGPSQVSQVSQGVTLAVQTADDLDLSVVAWSDADIAHFLARRARLIRLRWTEPDAERLAERLVIRDREGDDRVSCIECGQGRSLRCADVAPLPGSLLHRCAECRP